MAATGNVTITSVAGDAGSEKTVVVSNPAKHGQDNAFVGIINNYNTLYVRVADWPSFGEGRIVANARLRITITPDRDDPGNYYITGAVPALHGA